MKETSKNEKIIKELRTEYTKLQEKMRIREELRAEIDRKDEPRLTAETGAKVNNPNLNSGVSNSIASLIAKQVKQAKHDQQGKKRILTSREALTGRSSKKTQTP